MADSISLDTALKIGEIVTIIGSVGIGLFTIGRTSSKVETSIANQADDLTDMKDELKKLAAVVTMQAVQGTRLDNFSTQITILQRNVEDLRRGIGYITRNRSSVDGEYDK